ncbi:MAG: glycosyltransferase family 39 protein [Candidatus Omnitrophica bacterium]|nr:glycosyltransferase family 39 protein [Candidatus Omnitrophota bacterium]
MSVFLFHLLLPLLAAFVLSLYFVTLGRVILSRFTRETSFIENCALSFPLGIGCASTTIFFLGLIGQLRLWTFLSCILLSWILFHQETLSFLRELREWIKSLPERLSPFAVVLSFLLLTHLSLNLLFSLAPPIGTDALWHHLVLPKEYATTHSLTPRPDIVWSFGPQLVEMLLTLGMVFHSPALASLLCLMFSFSLLGALYKLGRQFLKRDVSLLAASLFWCMPLVIHYAPLIKNDLGMSVFIVLACDQCFLLTQKKPIGRTFLLLSAFLGLAASCKFTVLPSLIVIEGAALWSLRKRWRERGTGGTLLAGLLLMIALCLPYLIRSYCLTGNPVYPNAYRIFGGRFWNSEMTEVFSERYASPKNPVQLFTHPIRFSLAESFGGHVGTPLFLVFLPLLIFWRPLDRSVKKLLWMSLFIYTLSYLLFDVRSRYYFPVLCFLSLPTAYAIQKIWEERGIVRSVGSFWVGLFFLFNLFVTFAFTRHQIPTVLGMESSASYLLRMLSYHPVIQYTNEHTQPTDRIALFGVPSYYLERKSIYTNFYGGEVMFYILQTAEKLEKRLHELEIRYVIFPPDPVKEIAERLDWKLLGELRQKGILRKVYTKNGYTLYRFHPTP